jgi:hypothetical protein
MTQWVRLPIDVRCGRCGLLVAAQRPVQMMTMPGLKRRFYRGECCAGPAPVVEPVVPRTPRPPLPFTRTRELVATLPPDWTAER